jgi:ATP-dependent Clp protease ATP-binding subunit ClpB
VFNVLLQVLDDGRLTDGHGRTVDFRNTVVIMTSNLGSHVIQELMAADVHGRTSAAGNRMSGAAEENYAKMKQAVMEIVGQHFRPEFINRVDELVVFHPLGREQLHDIARIQVEYLKRRLAARELGFELSAAALERLAAVGYDPVYGARPLKRAIQHQIENPLAQEILAGRFAPGDTIRVGARGDVFVFEKA